MSDSVETSSVLLNVLCVAFGLFFQSTCTVMVQCGSLFLLPFGPSLRGRYMAHIMRLWSSALVAVVQYFAPGNLVLTLDSSCGASVESIVRRDPHGNVSGLLLPKRAIVTANHQIYADWVYIWCLAYLADAHGAMKIMLKHSLKNLPVYGMGMRFFDFIFLKRKLAFDQATIVDNLERSRLVGNPVWLVIFPEGTVISDETRERSRQFAKKNDLTDNRYTLLPRATGLRLCTSVLGDNTGTPGDKVEWLYDLTIGYSGLEPTDIPEQKYTISAIFFYGRQPRKIHIHLRRFRITEIPSQDEAAFSEWTFRRWKEKDQLLAHFYKYGQFPSEGPASTAEVPIRLKHSLLHLAQIYVLLLPYIPLVLLIRKIIHSIAA